MSRKKVFITGAAGFVGSHVADYFTKKKWQVMIGDNFTTGSIENIRHLKDAQIRELDITELPMMNNSGGIWQQMKEFEPDAVCHLAAQPSLLVSEQQPMFDASVNIYGTLNTMRAALNAGVKRFVFASTSAVYPDFYELHPLMERFGIVVADPQAEPIIHQPGSPYGISKMAAECYIRHLMPGNYAILRLGNVYGPRQVPLGKNQIVAQAMQHLHIGSDFIFNYPAPQTRDFVYVEDVARAFFLGATMDGDGFFNIASGQDTSINDLMETIMQTYPDERNESWEFGPSRDEPRQRVQMDISLAKDILRWEPKVSLEEGLKRTHAWWRQYASDHH